MSEENNSYRMEGLGQKRKGDIIIKESPEQKAKREAEKAMAEIKEATEKAKSAIAITTDEIITGKPANDRGRVWNR